MTNGCLCCAVKSNAVMALEKLMEKSGKFDYVLIETTGTGRHSSAVSVILFTVYLSFPLLTTVEKN